MSEDRGQRADKKKVRSWEGERKWELRIRKAESVYCRWKKII
jgi:hypothetical protein